MTEPAATPNGVRPSPPEGFNDVDRVVNRALERVGPHVVLATPIGLGKPVHLLNAFYRRAKSDPEIQLDVVTGLTLTPPEPRSDLERRLLEPMVDRIFSGWPELAWSADRRRDALPPNVRIYEFFLQPGTLLGSASAQQDYVASNYTHVVRDAMTRGMNVFCQMVGCRDGMCQTLSLGSNGDLTRDAVAAMKNDPDRRERTFVIADLNRCMPYMTGQAEVPASFFDAVLDVPAHTHLLFGPPNEPVTTSDWMIALYVSALIQDGGTLQLGIGSLADAVTRMLILRHREHDSWQRLLEAAGAHKRFPEVIERVGGSTRFRTGLYASTEMMVDGYFDLFREGILKRRVYPWIGIQRLVAAGRIGSAVDRGMLETLVREKVVKTPLDACGLSFLIACGVLRNEVRLEDDTLVLHDGERIATDLDAPGVLDAIERSALGEELRGGSVLHAAFFLGPRSFYESLRRLDERERDLFHLTSISFVNELYGEEKLKRLQRPAARFVNSALMITLMGAVVSDGLENGLVISGVGGQYNLAAMSHALPDARLIMMCRAVREKGGKASSNLRWRYGHVTLPRHLRDIVVTEYGIADLRGCSDAETIAALIQISDSRFQEELADQAKSAGKLPADWRVPDRFRQNTPEQIQRVLEPWVRSGELTPFPQGTDLTEEEVVLARVLRDLKERWKTKRLRIPSRAQWKKMFTVPDAAQPYLKRLGLDRPRGFKERWQRRLVLYALATNAALDEESNHG